LQKCSGVSKIEFHAQSKALSSVQALYPDI